MTNSGDDHLGKREYAPKICQQLYGPMPTQRHNEQRHGYKATRVISPSHPNGGSLLCVKQESRILQGIHRHCVKRPADSKARIRWFSVYTNNHPISAGINANPEHIKIESCLVPYHFLIPRRFTGGEANRAGVMHKIFVQYCRGERLGTHIHEAPVQGRTSTCLNRDNLAR